MSFLASTRVMCSVGKQTNDHGGLVVTRGICTHACAIVRRRLLYGNSEQGRPFREASTSLTVGMLTMYVPLVHRWYSHVGGVEQSRFGIGGTRRSPSPEHRTKPAHNSSTASSSTATINPWIYTAPGSASLLTLDLPLLVHDVLVTPGQTCASWGRKRRGGGGALFC